MVGLRNQLQATKFGGDKKKELKENKAKYSLNEIQMFNEVGRNITL